MRISHPYRPVDRAFFLSLLTIAVLEATTAAAAPGITGDTARSGLNNCVLRTDLKGRAVLDDRLDFVFRSSAPERCTRAPGHFDPSPTGIRMTPELPGLWSWGWGNRLTFAPDGFWPADTRIEVDFSGLNLPPATALDTDTLVFTTPVLHTTLAVADFLSDTTLDGPKFVTMRTRFSTRVTDKAAIRAGFKIVSTLPQALELGAPRFLWLNRDTELLVKIPVKRLAPASTLVAARLALPASPDGRDAKHFFPETAFEVRIPGREDFYRIEESSLTAKLDKRLRPEAVLTIRTTVAQTPAALLKALCVTALPEKLNSDANSPTDWRTAPVIDRSVLSRGEVLKVRALTDPDTPVDTIRLAVTGIKGRYIHAALPAGFGPSDDVRLKNDWSAVFKAAEPVRDIRFLQPGHMLSLTGTRRLTLHAEGLEKIRWRIARVRDEFLASESPVWGSLTNARGADETLEAKTGEMILPAGTRFATLDMKKMGFADRAAGLFEIEVEGWVKKAPSDNTADSRANSSWQRVASAQKRLLVTDIALLQKEARDGSRRVFAENMATATPAAGIEVSLVAANGLEIETMHTNRDGVADFSSTKGLTRERTPVAIIARSPVTHDMAWLSITDPVNLERNPGATDGKALSANGMTGLVFTERGLYRPGETVHTGLIATRGSLETLPAGLPLMLDVTDSAGRSILRRTVKLTAEGMADTSLLLSKKALPGDWRVKLSAGDELLAETHFRVADFTPEQMTLKLTNAVASEGWVKPDEVALNVSLKNRFGTDAPNRRLDISGRFDGQTTHRFARYPGWTFTDPTASDTTAVTLEKSVLKTDSRGRAELAPDMLTTLTQGGVARLLAEGFEPRSGRAATDDLTLLVSPASMMAGYRLTESANDLEALPAERPARLGIMVVDPKLRALTNIAITAETRRVEYRTALYEDQDGELRYRHEKVGKTVSSATLATNQNGLADITLTDGTAKEGDYVLTLRSAQGDFLADIAYRLTDNGIAALREGRLSDAPMTLTMTGTTVKPDSKTRLTLLAPFSGTAILTLESDAVKAYKRVTVREGRNTIDFEIPSTLFGKMRLNAHLLRDARDRTRLRKAYAFASVPLRIDDPARSVTPVLTAPAEVATPAAIPVTIQSDKPGRFFVWAVDDGVLDLTRYRTPDPKEAILWNRALQVKTYRSLDKLMPEDPVLPSPAFSLYGGGEAAADKALLSAAANPFRRTAEKAAVWWGGMVETGPDAKTLKMTLPEGFNGRVRLMAVGASEEVLSKHESLASFGSADLPVTVREPVVLTAALPAHVTTGDRFTTAVTVAPKTTGSGYLFIKSPELGMTQKVTLAANDEATLTWDLLAPDVPGVTDFSFAGLYNGGPLKKSVSLGVRPATLVEHESRWGLLPAAKIFVADELPAMTDYQARASMTVSSLPIPLIKGLLGTFDAAPGTMPIDMALEDAAARLAVLDAPLLLRNLGLDAEWRRDAENRLATVLTTLAEKTGREGVATPWAPSGDAVVTVRALDLLLTMKRAGRLADTALLSRLVRAVRQDVSRRRPATLSEARFDAYALMLVTMEGTLVPEEIESLRAHLEKTRPDWRDDTAALFLARAYRAMRMPDEAVLLEGEKKLDMTRVEDLSLYRSLSPVAALALAGRWGAKTRSQPLVRALLAQTPWSFLTLDRAAAVSYLTETVRESGKTARGLKSLSIRCTDSDFKAMLVTHTDSDAVRTLDFPGCRRFEVRSDELLADLYWETSVAGYRAEAPVVPVRNGLFVEKTMLVNGRALFIDENGAETNEARLRAGDIVTVEIKVGRDAGASDSPVILTDLLPGGFEPVDDARLTDDAEVLSKMPAGDRIVWRLKARPGASTVRFSMRAMAPGDFLVPAAQADDTTRPPLKARTAAVKRLIVTN